MYWKTCLSTIDYINQYYRLECGFCFGASLTSTPAGHSRAEKLSRSPSDPHLLRGLQGGDRLSDREADLLEGSQQQDLPILGVCEDGPRMD